MKVPSLSPLSRAILATFQQVDLSHGRLTNLRLLGDLGFKIERSGDDLILVDRHGGVHQLVDFFSAVSWADWAALEARLADFLDRPFDLEPKIPKTLYAQASTETLSDAQPQAGGRICAAGCYCFRSVWCCSGRSKW